AGPPRLVRPQRPRPAVAANPGPVREPRLGGDAPADAGRAHRPSLLRLARALADRHGPGGGIARGRDPRLARPRLQPTWAQPPPGRACRRRTGLAQRPDGA